MKRILLLALSASAFAAAVRAAYRVDVLAMVGLLTVAGAALAWAVRK